MYGALENEHLVREVQGITVQEIDFQLSDTGLMDQAVYVQVLGFTKIVHFFDNRIEFVDGVNAIGLPAFFPRALPVISGTRHSNSVMRFSLRQFLILSLDMLHHRMIISSWSL